MELDDLIGIARARWRIIVAIFLGALALASTYVFLTPAQYKSTASVFLSMNVDQQNIYAAQFALTNAAPSYAGLVNNAVITGPVGADPTINLDSTTLSSKVSAVVASSTVVIDVSAQDHDPLKAQMIAEKTAEALAAYLPKLQTGLKATITNPANLPAKPASPKKALDLAIAGIIGLLLGVAAAAIRDRLDKTIRTDKQVESANGGAVLAKVIHDTQASLKPLLTDIGEFASRAEAFRLLRTNLQFVDLDHPPRVFVVTSSVPAEGKTQTATNLAISMAKAGHRTLLVDGDLRRPTCASLLGLDSSVGLTTVLTGQIDLSKAIQVHPESGLHLLAAGKRPPNPTEVLQTQATRDLIAALREAYDAVIIDAPPLLPVADPAVLSSAADGAILVTRYGSTTVQQLEVAAARLESVGARVFGTVVNMVPRPDPGAYAYYMEYAPVAATDVRKVDRKRSKSA